jgi:HEPN domain-containing protein
MYHKLYEAAKLDFESAKILNDYNLSAPAIYHCAQAVEKCSKAIHAYYMIKLQHVPRHDVGDKLRKKYGPDLLESTRGIAKSLLELYIESEVNQDRKKGEIKKLEKIAGSKTPDIRKVIRHFYVLVNVIYNRYNLIINEKYDKLDPIQQLIEMEVSDANKKYLRYFYILLDLSGMLIHLEEYSRYPMNDLSYNNINLLNNIINKSDVNRITIMLDDLVGLVPGVWKQIDYFKNKIKIKINLT